jgi:aminoglycoside phosphotransferase
MIHTPQRISRRIINSEWTTISIGCSTAGVYRLLDIDGEATYLKVIDDKMSRQSLRPEYNRLKWLQGKLPVPKIIEYLIEDDSEYLWTSEIPGLHAAERSWVDHLPQMVRLLARGLLNIHSVLIEDCHFNKNVSIRVQEAEMNLIAGLVDEEDFDVKRKGRKPDELYREIIASIPRDEDLVFTHGDYCLPNILINGSILSGFIDWGNAGIADRYQDIALAVRSLSSNFGEEWGALFLQEYGLNNPDWAKIEFYQQLDEFF